MSRPRIMAFIIVFSFTIFLMLYSITTHIRFSRNTISIRTAVDDPLQMILEKLTKIERTLEQQESFKEYKKFRSKLELAVPKVIDSESDELNPHVLQKPKKDDIHKKYKILVLISSNAPHDKRRENIRKAWGNSSMWGTKQSFKVIFTVGANKDLKLMNRLNLEAQTYGDILIEDVEESFYQLSLKVMIGLLWVHTNINYDFILKCDDDIFVQMDRLMMKVEENKENGYIGQVMVAQPVMRKGRYGLTEEEHVNEKFDPYCSGGAFIISFDTVEKIIPYFDWFKPLKIDDAYIGQLVHRAGVKAIHEGGFHLWNRWCEYTDVLIISHPVKQEQCMDFMTKKSLIENGKLINETIKQQKYAFTEEQRKKL